jgi:sigma-B regulation protein RsbQ
MSGCLARAHKAMMFAHGFGCDQNMWRFITPAFEKDFQIILFDYVGAGKSDLNSYNEDRYSSLQGYAQDVVGNLRSIEFIGYHFCWPFCKQHDRILAAIEKPAYFSQLIMVGPSPCYINKEDYVGGFEHQDIEGLLETMEKNYIGWANFLAPQIMKNEDRPELGQELTESFCSTDPIIASQFARATFLSDNRKDLPKLKTPCLILQCSDDIIAPLEVGDFLQQHLSNSTLKVMKATGHCPHMSSPDETIIADQKLPWSNGMIATLFENAPCGYFVFDDDATILAVNETLAGILGKPKEELPGQNVASIFTLPTRIFFQTHLFPMIRLHGHAEEIFISFLAADGQHLPVVLNAKKMEWEGKPVTCCSCILVPNRKKFETELVTARKTAEKALQENSELIKAKSALQQQAEELDKQIQLVQKQNHELQQFSHAVTHNLREPLRKILMYTEKLSTEP